MVEHTTKREQTMLWTLTNETCGPTTKAKTEKKQVEKRERGTGKKGENKIKLESEEERLWKKCFFFELLLVCKKKKIASLGW